MMTWLLPTKEALPPAGEWFDKKGNSVWARDAEEICATIGQQLCRWLPPEDVVIMAGIRNQANPKLIHFNAEQINRRVENLGLPDDDACRAAFVHASTLAMAHEKAHTAQFEYYGLPAMEADQRFYELQADVVAGMFIGSVTPTVGESMDDAAVNDLIRNTLDVSYAIGSPEKNSTHPSPELRRKGCRRGIGNAGMYAVHEFKRMLGWTSKGGRVRLSSKSGLLFEDRMVDQKQSIKDVMETSYKIAKEVLASEEAEELMKQQQVYANEREKHLGRSKSIKRAGS